MAASRLSLLIGMVNVVRVSSPVAVRATTS